jgi:hypothetical protein
MLACNNDRPASQTPEASHASYDTNSEHSEASDGAKDDADVVGPPRDASPTAGVIAEDQPMTNEERLAATRRRMEIHDKARAWAGPDRRVTPVSRPEIEGLSFFSVKRDRPRGPPVPQYGDGVAWDHEADTPLEGDALMRAVIERTDDPTALAEAALLAYYPGGHLADPQRVPDAQRELLSPPEVSGRSLRFWALRPRARGRDLWRIDVHLDTLAHDAQRAEDL